MIKTFTIIILLSAAWHVGKAQPRPATTKEIDSVTSVVATQPADTNRVMSLYLLSRMLTLNNPDLALKYANEGWLLAQKMAFKKGEIVNLQAIGFVYSITGEWVKGTELCYRGIGLSEKYGMPLETLFFYHVMAIIFKKQNEDVKSIEWLLKIKNHPSFKNSDVYVGQWATLMDLGDSYSNLRQWDSAFYYGKTSYDLAVTNNLLNIVGQSLVVLGKSEAGRLHYKEALDYIHQAINVEKQYDIIFSISEAQYELAKVYAVINQSDSAIYYAGLALEGARTLNNLPLVKDASSLLAKEFEKTNIAKAYEYLSISNQAKDSLINAAKAKQLQQLEVKEQQRINDLHSAEIAFQNKIRQNTLFGVTGTLALLLFIFWRNNRVKQKTNSLLTEQKEQIQRTLIHLKSTQAQLIQSEKMASLGELTAGIAHEIQNPLNFVNNFSDVSKELIGELMEEADKGNMDDVKSIANDVVQNLDKIHHHGKRADAIVKGMLQHSRTSSGQMELTDLNALAGEYLRLAYHGLKARDKSFNADFECIPDPALPKVEVVPQDIGRVLLNLINNAFQAVNGYGDKPTVTVTTRKRDNIAEIVVADNGPGIPEAIRDKIFQPFFTTKPTGSGTGLGLSLSYDIIKAHGGEIKVKTVVGEGAEFIIVLPDSPRLA